MSGFAPEHRSSARRILSNTPRGLEILRQLRIVDGYQRTGVVGSGGIAGRFDFLSRLLETAGRHDSAVTRFAHKALVLLASGLRVLDRSAGNPAWLICLLRQSSDICWILPNIVRLS